MIKIIEPEEHLIIGIKDKEIVKISWEDFKKSPETKEIINYLKATIKMMKPKNK